MTSSPRRTFFSLLAVALLTALTACTIREGQESRTGWTWFKLTNPYTKKTVWCVSNNHGQSNDFAFSCDFSSPVQQR